MTIRQAHVLLESGDHDHAASVKLIAACYMAGTLADCETRRQLLAAARRAERRIARAQSLWTNWRDKMDRIVRQDRKKHLAQRVSRIDHRKIKAIDWASGAFGNMIEKQILAERWASPHERLAEACRIVEGVLSLPARVEAA